MAADLLPNSGRGPEDILVNLTKSGINTLKNTYDACRRIYTKTPKKTSAQIDAAIDAKYGDGTADLIKKMASLTKTIYNEVATDDKKIVDDVPVFTLTPPTA